MFRFFMKIAIVTGIILSILSGIALALGVRFPSHRLLYMATRGRASDQEIYAVQVERGLSISVTHERVVDGQPLVSPDGRWLIYRPNTETRSYSLINLDTGERQIVPELPEILTLTSFVWLEDDQIEFSVFGVSERRYFTYDPHTDEMQERIDNTIGPQPLVIAGKLNTNFPPIRLPLEDGANYEDWQQITMDDDGFPRFYDPDVASGGGGFLTDNVLNFSLSPDLETFAVPLYRNGQNDVFLVPARGGDPINLTNDSEVETNPVWSPNGRYLAYMVLNGPAREIRIMDVANRDVIYRSDEFLTSNQIVWVGE